MCIILFGFNISKFILLKILTKLPVKDILSFGATCKNYNLFVNWKLLWVNLIVRDLTNKHLEMNNLTAREYYQKAWSLMQLQKFQVYNDSNCEHLSLQELSQVKHLICNKKTHRVPYGFSYLTNLRKINIFGCDLQSVPEWIGYLAQLRQLRLSKNQLSSLPETVSRLTNLISIDLSYNKFTQVPPCLNNMDIRALNMIYNSLSGEQNIHLPNASHLFMENNGYLKLPEWIYRSTKLVTLIIPNNNISWISPKIGNLFLLQNLNLGSNRIRDVPIQVGQLTNLEYLGLECNLLTGMPKCIVNLTNLSLFDISNNKIKNIDYDISHLTNLGSLDISYNQLTNFPPALCELTNLTRLELQFNMIKCIPQEVNRIRWLSYVDLSGNEIEDYSHHFREGCQVINLTGNPINKTSLDSILCLGNEQIQFN